MIYLNLDLATIVQEDPEGITRNTIRLVQYLLELSNKNFQVLVVYTCTNRGPSNEVIISIENLEALKAFQEVMVPQVTDAPWITNSDLKIWQLVSPVIFQDNSLLFVPASKDSFHSLRELIAVLEEQERIEAVKSQIREAALSLNQQLCRLPVSVHNSPLYFFS